MQPLVSVVVLAWNSRPHLDALVSGLLGQTYSYWELVVVDNGSSDDSADFLQGAFPQAKVLRNEQNRGFAVGCNQAIAACTGVYVQLLNHDVKLEPEYLQKLVEALEAEPSAGWAAGKLLRPPLVVDQSLVPSGHIVPAPSGKASSAGQSTVNSKVPLLIDSAGEVIKRNRRVVNRGEEEPDVGQYDDACEIFGVSAAAAMYRRQMLAEVAPDGAVFDPDFFAYIEDSDLNWRCRNAGWRCLYVPAAVGIHARGHATTKALKIRRHAYANRYLMIAKNDTPANFLRDLPEIAMYETYRLLKCLLAERELLAAYGQVLKQLPGALARRRFIQGSRKARSAELRAWYAADDYLRRVARGR